MNIRYPIYEGVYRILTFLVRAAIVTFPLFFNLLICLSIYCLQCRPAFILSLSMGKSTLFRIRKSGLLSPKFPGLTRQSPLFRTQKSLVSRLTLILHDHPHLQLRVCPPSNWTTVIQLMPTSNPDRKGPSIPATRNA